MTLAVTLLAVVLICVLIVPKWGAAQHLPNLSPRGGSTPSIWQRQTRLLEQNFLWATAGRMDKHQTTDSGDGEEDEHTVWETKQGVEYQVVVVPHGPGVTLDIPTTAHTTYNVWLRCTHPQAAVTVACRFTGVSVAVYFQEVFQTNLTRTAPHEPLLYRFTNRGPEGGSLRVSVREGGGEVTCNASTVDTGPRECDCGIQSNAKRVRELGQSMLDDGIRTNGSTMETVTPSERWTMKRIRIQPTGINRLKDAGSNNRTVLAGADQAPSPRIVGGQVVTGRSQPWLVSLIYMDLYNDVHFCGGSIISERWVLTAAHCLSPFPFRYKYRLRVVAGVDDLLKATKADYYSVDTIVVHPSYNQDAIINDIALLRVAGGFSWDGEGRVRAVCLPLAGEESPPNMAAWVAGWGVISADGGQSSSLRVAVVHTVALEECRRMYEELFGGHDGEGSTPEGAEERKREKDEGEEVKTNASPAERGHWLEDAARGADANAVVPDATEEDARAPARGRGKWSPSFRIRKSPSLTNKMICARNQHSKADACQGDSGGALLQESTTGRTMQVGVVSWGEGCGDPSRPGVYTRVSKFVQWINRTVGPGGFCTV